MLSNPLIQRYRYSSFRKRQVWIYATIYISVIILLLFINYSIYLIHSAFGGIDNFFKSLFFQFITFQVLILWAWGSYNSGSAIKDEVLEKSYDFFRMLPIPAWEKAVGILVGKNLVVLLMAGINFLFIFVFGILGRISLYLEIQILFVLLSMAVLANSAGLLSSVCKVPKKKSSNPIVLIILAFFTVPYLLAGIYQLSESENLESFHVKFFGIDIPLLILISLIALYFSFWVFTGVICKFNRERDPLFTMKGAFLFAIGYELIAVGLFIPYLLHEAPVVYAFWITTLPPAVIVAFGSLKGMEHYIEYSRTIQEKRSAKKHSMTRMLAYSNLSVGLGLFAIWSIFATSMVIADKGNLPANLHSILTLFSSYLFIILLVELYSIYKSSNPKIGLLVGFIMILYFSLPLVFGGIMENEFVVLYSPFGYIANLFAEFIEEPIADLSIWVINFLLCVIPAIIVLNKYRLILTTREKMSSLNGVQA
ncbi:MAG: hypothetical protein FVQ79_02995 [Planctomycetes bacterium]|nr:hypothetical protein [Planctomycetota bacterium]